MKTINLKWESSSSSYMSTVHWLGVLHIGSFKDPDKWSIHHLELCQSSQQILIIRSHLLTIKKVTCVTSAHFPLANWSHLATFNIKNRETQSYPKGRRKRNIHSVDSTNDYCGLYVLRAIHVSEYVFKGILTGEHSSGCHLGYRWSKQKSCL